MKFALNFARYTLHFIRLILSVSCILIGYLIISDISFWENTHQFATYEKLICLTLFIFSALALWACNKLVNTLKSIKNNEIFNRENTIAFKWASGVCGLYIMGKHLLLLYILSSIKDSLAWSEWMDSISTQLAEIISFGLLACFFWVIAKIIEEGVIYKTENELTI